MLGGGRVHDVVALRPVARRGELHGAVFNRLPDVGAVLVALATAARRPGLLFASYGKHIRHASGSLGAQSPEAWYSASSACALPGLHDMVEPSHSSRPSPKASVLGVETHAAP